MSIVENNFSQEKWLDENEFDVSDDDYSDDEFFVDYDEETKKIDLQSNRANAQGNSERISSFQPNEKLFKKFTNRINVEKYEGATLPHNAANKLTEANRKQDANLHRSKDKQDRATAELVMDPRTRMILFKLLNRGMITEINGCISTGLFLSILM